MKLTIAMENKQWQKIIDPNAIQLTKYKFYIKNKNKFGNARFLFKYFICPWLIIWIGYTIYATIPQLCTDIECDEKNAIIYMIGIVFNESFSCLVLLFIYCAIPRFNDYFYISQELKRIIILGSIAPLNDFLISIFIMLYPHKVSGWPWSLNTIIDITIMTLTSLISTFWVLRKLNKFLISVPKQRSKSSKQEDFQESLMSSLYTKSDNNNSLDFDIKNDLQSIQFQSILTENDAFEGFVQYLSKELSIEFLLAFIEIIQLQQFVAQKNEKYLNEQSLYNDFKFYDNMVKSDIVYDDKKYKKDECKYDDDMIIMIKQKSDKLYKKYIEFGSEYEIILSNETHMEITDLMSHIDWIYDHDITIDMILKLWNDVTKELFILLMNSFNRFQTTKKCLKVKPAKNFSVNASQQS